MKILIVGFGGGKAVVSGPRAYRDLLLPRLKALGGEVSIALVGFRHGVRSEAETLRGAGYGCQAIPLEAHPYDEDRARALLAYVAEFRPDVVWLDNVGFAWSVVPHLRTQGIATIGIIHSDDAFHRALLNASSRGGFLPDSIIGVSQKLHREIQTAIPASREAFYLPCGIVLPEARTNFAEPFRLIYVGRLEIEQKQVDQLTRLLIRATTEIPGLAAVIFGAGSWQASLQKMLAEVKGHRVEFKGILQRTDLYGELARAQVFALWSEYEGTPIAVLEAMACGVVPVCRRIESGLPELFGANESGILVDSEAEFIQTLRILSQNLDQWQALSDSARQTAQKFSADVNAQKVHELMERTIERTRSSGSNSRKNSKSDAKLSILPPMDPAFIRYERRRPPWPLSLVGYVRMRLAAWKRRKGNIL